MVSVKDKNYIQDPCEEMARLARTFLDLNRWGFHECTRIEATSPKIIYNSKWCRLKLIWDGWEMYNGYTIGILYSRLHAPDDRHCMNWDNEECYCWHRVEPALHFLDKLPPDTAAKMDYSHPLKKQFRESDFGKNILYQPEWLIRMHGAIWEQYALRLFELFDLRRPDLWEKYRQYLKEVYDIKGRIPEITPSLDKIC